MTLELPEIPRALRRGGKLEDTDRAAQDAVAIIDLVCRNLGEVYKFSSKNPLFHAFLS